MKFYGIELYNSACVATTWISYRYIPCHPWCTHRTSLVVKKKNFFSFLVVVKNSIKVGPLVFLLYMFFHHGELFETPCIRARIYSYVLWRYLTKEKF